MFWINELFCVFSMVVSLLIHAFHTYIACHYLILSLNCIKADLLAQYGGVAPKMAEEAHSRVIDQVSQLRNKFPL